MITNIANNVLRQSLAVLLVLMMCLCVIYLMPLDVLAQKGLWGTIDDIWTTIGIKQGIIDGHVSMINDYKTDNHTDETTIGVLEGTVSSYNTEIQQLQEDKDKASENAEAAGKRLSGARVEKALAEIDRSEALDMIYELSHSPTAVEYWQQKLAEAEAAIAAANEKISQASRDQTAYENQKNYLSGKIFRKEFLRSEAQEEISRRNGEIARRNGLISGLEGKIDPLVKEIDALKEEVEDLRKQIQTLTQTVNTLTRTVNTLTQTINTLKANEEENREQIRQLEGQVQELNNQIQELRDQIGEQ